MAVVLNDGGLAGLGGHVHAALEAAVGWHLQRARLLGRSEKTLGGDLLNILPAERNTKHRKASQAARNHCRPASHREVKPEKGHNIPGVARHDVVDVRSLEAVEGGRGGHRVGAHVLEDQPVAQLQLGQVTLLHDAVEAVACRTPDTAGVHFLVRLWLLSASRGTKKRWLKK